MRDGAHVIPAFAVEVHRDLRDGVELAASVERRLPPEAKARFIAAMKEDVRRAGDAVPAPTMRATFREMGLPEGWIDEVLDPPALPLSGADRP